MSTERSPQRRSRPGHWLAAATASLLVSAVLTIGGCGQQMPEMTSAKTMHLLTALRTACSAQKPAYLEELRQRVEEARQEERLSDAEYDKLLEIIETAAGGDWELAEKACFQFQKANSG